MLHLELWLSFLSRIVLKVFWLKAFFLVNFIMNKIDFEIILNLLFVFIIPNGMTKIKKIIMVSLYLVSVAKSSVLQGVANRSKNW